MKTLPCRPHWIALAAPPLSFRRIQALLLGCAISLFSLLAAPGFLPTAYAQTNTLRFERISTEQGLAQNTVTAILQDRQGFLWFDTEGGLNRYDGYEFKTFQRDPDNSQTLGNNAVFSLYQDRSGVLWVGTASGLDRFNPSTETFAHFVHSANEPTGLGGSFVQAICEDRTGMLWIRTENGGLDKLDPTTGVFTHYRHSAGDPGSLSDDAVETIYEDHEGTLWVGTNVALDRFDGSTGTFAHYRQSPGSANLVNDNTVLAILEHNGALWFGTRSGLVQLDPSSGHLIEYRNNPGDPSSLGSDSVAFLYEDSEGALWLGTREGLDRLDSEQKGFVHYRYDRNDPHSLSSDYVRSIFQDRSGVLWIGTADGGLSKSSPSGQKFELYQSRSGESNTLSDDNIWAVHEAHDGTLWIGTFFAGLNALDKSSGKVTPYRHDPNKSGSLLSDEVRVITEDAGDNLWVGTEHGGLDRFDPATNGFVHYRHDSDNPSSLSDNDVFSIFEDREHRLWVGTQNGGLNRLNSSDGTFKHYLHDADDPASLSDNQVESIYQDTSGRLWVATLGGLDLWDSGHDQFVHYRHDPQNPASLSSDLVTGISQNADGVYWVATYGGGLNRFDPARGSFAHFNVKNGLADDTVYGILADAHGLLWLSTNKGLSRFDPRTATFRNYTTSDGLQGNQFNPRAYFKSQAGGMFFGGVRGLNGFYPDQVRDNPYLPTVVITAFKKLNQPVNVDLTGQKAIQLSYQDYVVSFEFAALDFNAPDKNRYAYKLEGVDPDWVYAGTRHYASYTNLAGGNYVFRVKASNSDGIWGPDQVALNVEVAPPYWETWWFRGGLAIMLALGATIAYRMHIRDVRARALAEATAANAERSRLARELHDSVSQSLYGVTLYAQAAAEALAQGDTGTVGKHLIELRDTGQEALREMRLLIFQLRPPLLEKSGLVAALQARLDAVERRGGMQAELHVEGSDHLPHEMQAELYNIAQEALNNALKHAHAQHVQIHLRFDESVTGMEICDDGVGFEPEIAHLGGGFGISGMRDRAKKIGATLRIESVPDQGTRVEVRVPHNSYRPKDKVPARMPGKTEG